MSYIKGDKLRLLTLQYCVEMSMINAKTAGVDAAAEDVADVAKFMDD